MDELTLLDWKRRVFELYAEVRAEPAAAATCSTPVEGSDLGGVDERVVLDFNFAYNPSCAYDPRWVCPLAPPGNRLAVEVRGGERHPI